jgi:16S rRNA (adenine1518-N6/adenine1519-N6)-dimethyltransferase
MSIDLTNPATVGAVARRAGFGTKKRLGQHFLVDRQVLDRIVAALDPAGTDVLEVGPGIGTLTTELAAVAGRVVAVDLDPGCIRACEITLRAFGNVDLVEADILRTEPAGLGLREDYIVAGNIPYNITGAIINHLLERSDPPRRTVLLVQREVAARLAGDAEEWSLATVAVRSLATVERLGDVPPSSFEPAPEVHSSIIRLTPSGRWNPGERRAVLDVARAAFQFRRKTLRHGITRALDGDEGGALHCLRMAGIDPSRRPGTLTLDEWRGLAAAASDLPTPIRGHRE